LWVASLYSVFCLFVFFFFQAEDGIRDRNVTGVQTCALPISGDLCVVACGVGADACIGPGTFRRRESPRADMESVPAKSAFFHRRSEERRVGKECRFG